MRGADLYIVQMAVTGDIKVGRSGNVKRRMGELQTGCPHRLRLIIHLPKMGHLERTVHQTMRSHKTRHGSWEWFREPALAELPVWIYNHLDLENQDWWMTP
jgi:hypothetical protein